jgi:hypothetical protein
MITKLAISDENVSGIFIAAEWEFRTGGMGILYQRVPACDENNS